MDDFIPTFHEIETWLANNRAYTSDVRIAALEKTTLRNVDIDTLRHFAAAYFVQCDQARQSSEALPGLLHQVIKTGKAMSDRVEKQRTSKKQKKAADAKNVLKGYADKRDSIRWTWATGKYSSRDLCAEQECAVLDMSLSTARKALRNTPDPDPWPARGRA